MNNIICKAINARLVLKIYCDGGFRLIEPHCYGIGISGDELLRSFQISDYNTSYMSNEWKLFTVTDIESIVITEQKFQGPRSSYVRNDSAMQHIYCQL